MNRRDFTIASALTGITIISAPGFAFGAQQYSKDELIGTAKLNGHGGAINLRKSNCCITVSIYLHFHCSIINQITS